MALKSTKTISSGCSSSPPPHAQVSYWLKLGDKIISGQEARTPHFQGGVGFQHFFPASVDLQNSFRYEAGNYFHAQRTRARHFLLLQYFDTRPSWGDMDQKIGDFKWLPAWSRGERPLWSLPGQTVRRPHPIVVVYFYVSLCRAPTFSQAANLFMGRLLFHGTPTFSVDANFSIGRQLFYRVPTFS